MTPNRAAPFVLFLTLSCVVGFCAVAWAVSAGATEALDRSLMLMTRVEGDTSDALGPPWFEAMLAEITALGGYTILVITSGLVVATLLLLGLQRAAVFLLLSLAGGAIASSLLKLVFARPRPDLVEKLDQTFTSSFPSAHAMVATLAYLTLATVGMRFVKERAPRVFILVAAILLAVSIGVSRVYLGVHWPSDVLAGWLAGGAWAGAAWLAADAWNRSYAVPGHIGHSHV